MIKGITWSLTKNLMKVTNLEVWSFQAPNHTTNKILVDCIEVLKSWKLP